MPDVKLEQAWERFQETMRVLRQKQRGVIDAYAKRLDAKRIVAAQARIAALKK